MPNASCRANTCTAEAVTGWLGARHLPILVCQEHADALADRTPFEVLDGTRLLIGHAEQP